MRVKEESEKAGLKLNIKKTNGIWSHWFSSVNSVNHSYLTRCQPMDCSMPGLRFHHQLLELSQAHVHRDGDAIQPSHPLFLSPSINLSIWVFSNESALHINIGVSTLASVLPMNIQDWFPLGWTGWITLQSKGLSRVFFNTTVQKHQFFGAQLSLYSNSHIRTWQLEKP